MSNSNWIPSDFETKLISRVKASADRLDAMKSMKFAIVNTVDSIPELCAVVERGVFLFETESQAVHWAVEVLVKIGLLKTHVKGQVCDDDWIPFESETEALEYFQDQLSDTEYFHVLSIQSQESTSPNCICFVCGAEIPAEQFTCDQCHNEWMEKEFGRQS